MLHGHEKERNTSYDSCVVISGMVMLNKTETLCVNLELDKSFAEKYLVSRWRTKEEWDVTKTHESAVITVDE